MSVIKAGYRLTVTSWENDADNYNTVVVDGLTKDQVELAVDFIKLVAKSSCNHKGYYGNMYDPDDGEIAQFDAAITEVLKKHNIEEEYPLDYARELYWDYGLASEFYTRVAEKVVVEFVPQDIEISEVTTEFIK